MPDLLFSVFSDRTCVSKNNVSFRHFGAGGVASGRQNAADDFRVRRVHLTAVSFYVKLQSIAGCIWSWNSIFLIHTTYYCIPSHELRQIWMLCKLWLCRQMPHIAQYPLTA